LHGLIGASGAFTYTRFMVRSNSANDETLFCARLVPYRSLGQQGFRILISLVSLFCFLAGLGFYLAGLWPVVGFLGLDVALIYWAFKASYRSGRAYEEVAVSRKHVSLSKVSPRGRRCDHNFPQFGTRFEVDRHDEIGITKMKLANRQHKVELGSFLNPADKESFAEAFGLALARAKF